jgi:hypothetical protein
MGGARTGVNPGGVRLRCHRRDTGSRLPDMIAVSFRVMTTVFLSKTASECVICQW